jgi:hypothetical protein
VLWTDPNPGHAPDPKLLAIEPTSEKRSPLTGHTRTRLTVRFDKGNGAVFALTLAKNGAKLKQPKSGEECFIHTARTGALDRDAATYGIHTEFDYSLNSPPAMLKATRVVPFSSRFRSSSG